MPTSIQVDVMHPVQANTLTCDFTASAPNQKLVANNAYIPTPRRLAVCRGYSRSVRVLSGGSVHDESSPHGSGDVCLADSPSAVVYEDFEENINLLRSPIQNEDRLNTKD